MKFISALILCLVFDFQPVHAQQQTAKSETDIPLLLREAEQKTNQNCVKYLESLSDYTYKTRYIKREKHKDGTFEEESLVAEVYVVDLKKVRSRNRRVATRIVIEKNGKPVSPGKIEKERVKVSRDLAKDDERPPDSDGHVSASCQWEGKYVWLTGNYFVPAAGQVISTYRLHTPAFLTTADFHSPQYETINDRQTISLTFTPRPNSTFDENMRWAAKAEGKIWIDAEDKVIVRVAMWPRNQKPADATAGALRQSGAVFFEQIRMKDGLWFDSYRRFDANRFPETATIWKKELVWESFDFERFDVQAEKEKLATPDKPPTEKPEKP